MGYTDINAKAIGFARSGGRERRSKIYLKNKEAEKQQAKVDKLQAALDAEQEILGDMHADVSDWEQEMESLRELDQELKKPRSDFDDYTDEEFEDRCLALRWQIADITGYYTFITKGSELEALQGGF